MAYDSADQPNPPKKRLVLDDDDFLAIVREERRQSLGFEEDRDLMAQREMALNYTKGEMPDLPHLQNRSGAVSTDVLDAINTAMPDLIEILHDGDDVMTFKPMSEADEEACKQETEYVRHVMFSENKGFLVTHSFIMDALQSKLGVVKFWWEDDPIEPEMFTGKTLVELALAHQDGEVEDIQPAGQDEQGQPLYNFTLTREQPEGRVCVQAVAPEDWTVAKDAVLGREFTYCAFRTRPRAQDLIEQGIDEDTVRNLPNYSTNGSQTLNLARDDAGEHIQGTPVVGLHNMRAVEVIEHFVRVDADGDGKPELWRVLTGGTETVFIEKEQIDRLPFAVQTPFPISHRLYGFSLADLLLEIQRVKTALTRMFLDSGYFALNARNEVSQEKSNHWTLSDLLRNEPGVPVRSKTGDAVRPITSGTLEFDAMAALEHFSVAGEQRTGIVRNAQGLNPDTLHETATGAMALIGAAQKRLRLIARVLAETGFRDLYLGIHALLRKHRSATSARLGNKWVPVDPSQWAERNEMSISIGLGSAGRQEELQALQLIAQVQKEIVTMQGGAQGPLVTLENIFNSSTRLAERAGEKTPTLYFTDPSQSPPMPPPPQQGAAEAQVKAQISQAQLAQQDKEHQDRMTLDGMVEHDKDERERLKLANDMQIAMAQNASEERIKMAELEVKRADVINRLQMKQAELANQLQIAQISAGVSMNDTQTRAQAEADRAAVDIEMQARDHAHEDDLADYVAAQDPETAAESPD